MQQSKLPPSFKASTLTREHVKARLAIADTPKAAMTAEDPAGAQFILNVMEILPYDKNPRQSVYEDFAELKEGIRLQGFQGAFPVTRRPGEKAYMLAQGYNQRLKAMQELWQETRDEKYRDVPAVYVPWTTESANQARHLAENLNRSDMTFWDKATGFLTFKVTREAELKAPLTLRKLEDEAKKAGLQVSTSTLGLYLFAAESLAELRHEIRTTLSYDEIKALQPELTRIRALTNRIREAGAFLYVLTSAVEIVNRQFISSAWSVRAFVQECKIQAAQLLAINPDHISAILDLSERFPTLSREELLQAATEPIPEAPPKARRGKQSEVAPSPEQPSPVVAKRSEPSFPAPSGPAAPAATTFPALDIVESAPPTPVLNISALLDHAWFHAEQFARAAQVDDLLRRGDKMPAGFYVEVQPESDPNLDFDPREHRHAGWWMLAAVSGQMDQTLSARLPVDSTWRRAHREEDPDLTIDFLVQERLGMFCYLPPVAPWLTEPGHPLGEAYFALLATLRALRVAAPERFTEAPTP